MKYAEMPIPPAPTPGELLPLDRISPRPSLRQPQEPASLDALAESIRRHGLVRPVTVRCLSRGRYVIVSGNRRLMACRMLGMTCIAAHILRQDAAWLPAEHLLEALGCHRLHYLEEAEALHVLHTLHRMPWEELARLSGSTPRTASSQAGLASLPDDLKALLLEERVPLDVALLLLRLPDDASRLRAANAIIRERLCVRDASLLVAAERRRPVKQGTFQEPAPDDAPPRRKVVCVVRDHRLYLNALRDIAGQMQAAGVAATIDERRIPGQVEMVIRVPVRRRRMERYHSS